VLTLAKELSLTKWNAASGSESRPYLFGTGTVTFDQAEGLPIASKMSYRTEDHPQLGTVSYTFTYRLAKSGLAARVKAAAEKKIEPAQEVRNAINELKAGTIDASYAIGRISYVPAIAELHDEVDNFIKPYVLSSDDKVCIKSLDVAKKWNCHIERETLFQLVESKEPSIRRRALELLGERFKTSETALRIGKKYREHLYGGYVVTAWELIGPPAEEAVILELQKTMLEETRNLASKEITVRQLVGVLGKIGGRKSIDLLTIYTVKDTPGLKKSLFENSLQACRKRMPAEENAPTQ